jgi:hypothetical protein
MDQLTIIVSPKLSAVLKKSGKAVSLINDFMTKFLESAIDGKLSFVELIQLLVILANVVKSLVTK